MVGRILARINEYATKAWFEKAYSEIIERIDVDSIPGGKLASSLPDGKLAEGLRLRSICAEICDYVGQYDRARDFVQGPGELCFRALNTKLRGGKDAPSGDLLLQYVWVTLQAGLCEYRRLRLGEAFEMFRISELVIAQHLVREGREPRYGVRARALYSMGLVYREQYRLEEAIRCFTQSTELAYLSYQHGHTHPPEDELLSERAGKAPAPVRTTRLELLAIARAIGMGLASVYSTAGRPDLAIPMLTGAKVLLPAEDRIISTHIDLIQSTLSAWRYPGESANEESEYTDSVSTKPIEDCYERFRLMEHRAYRARAAYYLARHYIRQAERDDNGRRRETEIEGLLRRAETLIKELELSISGSLQLSAFGLVLETEILRLREKFSEAEDHAKRTERIVSEEHLPAVFVELMMSKGRIQLSRHDYRGATRSFQRGLRVTTLAKNRAMSAIFLLRLCETSLSAGSDQEAWQTYSDYEKEKSSLEVFTSEISRIESVVKRKLDQQQLSKGIAYALKLGDHMNFKLEQASFRAAWIRWALTKTKSEVEAAGLIGISRQTFRSWKSATHWNGKKTKPKRKDRQV